MDSNIYDDYPDRLSYCFAAKILKAMELDFQKEVFHQSFLNKIIVGSDWKMELVAGSVLIFVCVCIRTHSYFCIHV